MLHAIGSVQISAAPYVMTILTVLVTCIVILAWASLLDSDLDTPLARAIQKVRLSRSRMGRMLRRRHVSVAAYANSLPMLEMKQQVQTCRNCRLQDLCDRALAGRGPSRSSFSFCPNRPAIERHLAPLVRLHVANG